MTHSVPDPPGGSDTIEDFSIIPGLNPADQNRLALIFDEYLQRVERGEQPALDELVQQAPELAEHIERFFESVKFLRTVPTDATLHSTEQASGAELAAGQRLGDFELIRELGRGGMAVVYEAKQRSLGRTVALKVLPFWTGASGKQIVRFRNEAQALAQLQHPHIVPVFAVGEENGIHYFAMRLIDGLSCDAVVRLRHSADFPGPEPGLARYRWIARTGASVASALHAAHEYGVVHRDVKPSNLLLGRDGVPWVADFGLARINSASDLTGSGDLVGTLRYMSPEQTRGDLVDHRTDVYSLGVTLYELVTGRPAYDSLLGADLLLEIAREDPPRPRSIVPDVPRDLENILMKAAARSRDDRYATAAEFAADLERFAAGEPVLARRPGIVERVARWLRRHRNTAFVLVAVLLVATFASAISTAVIYRQKQITDAALAESDRNFRRAREVVDRFGAQLAEELSLLPDAREIRRNLLIDTISYYREFIEQTEHSDNVETELATALNKIALLTEQIGSDADALAAHREALNAFTRLVEREPEVAAHRASLALCQNNVGLLLCRKGEFDEADALFRRAVTIQESLRKKYPTRPEFARDLGLSLNNLGLLLSDRGRIHEAKDAYLAAVALQQDEAGSPATDDRSLRYLAATYSNLAALQAADSPEAARQSYSDAVRIQRTLTERNPHRTDFRRDLALTMNNLAALNSRNGDHATAEVMYREAVRIHRDLLETAPGSVTAHRDLAVSENNFGLAAARAGNTGAAEAAFRRAIDLLQPLTDSDDASAEDRGSLGSIWNNLALVLDESSQPEEVLAAYQHSVELLTGALLLESDAAKFRGALGRSLLNMARVLNRQKRVAEALATVLKYRSLWPGDASKLPGVAEELAAIGESVEPDDAAGTSPSRSEILRVIADLLKEAYSAGMTIDDVGQTPHLSRLLDDVEFKRLTSF